MASDSDAGLGPLGQPNVATTSAGNPGIQRWSHGRSLWQSNFSCPLTSTSLRAYLSPQKEKKLKSQAPVQDLEKQYYTEAIKFSYIRGQFDSADLNLHNRQKKRHHPLGHIDNVKDIIRDSDTESQDEKSRAEQPNVRKKVRGQGCTTSSIEGSILEHPEELPLPGGLMTGGSTGSKNWKVSGKIGARPGRTDKTGRPCERTWAPSDISVLSFQEESDVSTQGGPCGAAHVNPEAHSPAIQAQSSKGETMRGSCRPTAQKPGRSLRSGIMSLARGAPPKHRAAADNQAVPEHEAASGNRTARGNQAMPQHEAVGASRTLQQQDVPLVIGSRASLKHEAASGNRALLQQEAVAGSRPLAQKQLGIVPISGVCSLPLAPCTEPLVKSSSAVVAEVRPAAATVAPRVEKPLFYKRSQTDRLQVEAEPEGDSETPHYSKFTFSRLQAIGAAAGANIAEGPAAQPPERLPQRLVRKAKEAAYMPLVSLKPKLMDHVEKTLFSVGIKALRERRNLSSASTDTH